MNDLPSNMPQLLPPIDLEKHPKLKPYWEKRVKRAAELRRKHPDGLPRAEQWTDEEYRQKMAEKQAELERQRYLDEKWQADRDASDRFIERAFFFGAGVTVGVLVIHPILKALGII